jgi:hypothetical protein
MNDVLEDVEDDAWMSEDDTLVWRTHALLE